MYDGAGLMFLLTQVTEEGTTASSMPSEDDYQSVSIDATLSKALESHPLPPHRKVDVLHGFADYKTQLTKYLRSLGDVVVTKEHIDAFSEQMRKRRRTE